MRKNRISKAEKSVDPLHSKASEFLLDLISRTPTTSEMESRTPFERAIELKRSACLKAAAISGALAIPPGPLGMATILPDLMTIWRLQQQLVADIAGCFGKQATLTREVMLFCLFRHGAAILARDFVVRMGERILVRRIALRTLQQIMRKIGLQITQKAIGKTLSRYIPVIGAAGIAGYAFYDTKSVAEAAIELFSKPIVLEGWLNTDSES